MAEEEVNYKLIYQKLVEKYPEIAQELTRSDPTLDGFEMLKVFTLFCRIKGVYQLSLPVDNDRSNLRALFVAVFVKIYDPDFFLWQKRHLRRGLRVKMASLLNCHETQISHILASVRTYMKAYKNFRLEVIYIYSEIVKHLDNEHQIRRKELSTSRREEQSCYQKIS